jgi:hypothetical protein
LASTLLEHHRDDLEDPFALSEREEWRHEHGELLLRQASSPARASTAETAEPRRQASSNDLGPLAVRLPGVVARSSPLLNVSPRSSGVSPSPRLRPLCRSGSERIRHHPQSGRLLAIPTATWVGDGGQRRPIQRTLTPEDMALVSWHGPCRKAVYSCGCRAPRLPSRPPPSFEPRRLKGSPPVSGNR